MLQHGLTPVDLEGVELMVSLGGGTVQRIPAYRSGAVGHYTATVTFPSAGEWRWEVLQGWFGRHPLGTVRVGSAAAAGTARDGGVDPAVLAALAGSVLLAGLGVSLTRRRTALAPTPSTGA